MRNTAYAESICPASSFNRARAHAAQVELSLASAEMIRAEHADVEAFLDKASIEWGRLMFQEYLDLRADREQPVKVVDTNRIEHNGTRDSQRGLESVFGTVEVPRQAYRAPGSADLHPMDAALNLPPELFSHGVRRIVAKEIARASFDEVVELVHDRSGAVIAKRQVEELTIRAARDFDRFYTLRQRELGAVGDFLVITTDGKGIVVRHADLREATRLAAERSVFKIETRLTPGEKSNRKRMAQVAVVYSVAPWARTAADVLHTLRDENAEAKRPVPRMKRVWASIEKHPRKLIRAAFEEAHRRDPTHRRAWVVLVDGERKQLAAVKTEARRLDVDVTIIVDLVHVLEYIWMAARALFDGSCAEAEEWVGNRLLALLTGSSGGYVARTIRGWAKRRTKPLTKEGRAAINKACRYLADRSRTRLMNYEAALAYGMPISTGVVEGACRYLVKDRMDRTGARWSLAGAEAVLKLRALRASHDFDAYWAFHLKCEKERHHISAYADGVIPDPLPARRSHLRRLK